MENEFYIIDVPFSEKIFELASSIGYSSSFVWGKENSEFVSEMKLVSDVPIYSPKNQNDAIKMMNRSGIRRPLIIRVGLIEAVKIITKNVAKFASNTKPIPIAVLLEIDDFLFKPERNYSNNKLNRIYSLYLMRQTIEILESNRTPMLFTTKVTEDKPWKIRSPETMISLIRYLGASEKNATDSITTIPKKIEELWNKIK
ncbi:MAG: hypothetical protein ACTSUV_05020 [Candidatus Ranarchaeia archaeon]